MRQPHVPQPSVGRWPMAKTGGSSADRMSRVECGISAVFHGSGFFDLLAASAPHAGQHKSAAMTSRV
eukprot:4635426-Prymnesium_polylepis.2